jgi:hypothetical protein
VDWLEQVNQSYQDFQSVLNLQMTQILGELDQVREKIRSAGFGDSCAQILAEMKEQVGEPVWPESVEEEPEPVDQETQDPDEEE